MSTGGERARSIEERNLVFAREWVAAWNSHDLDQIMSHYAAPLDFRSPLIIQRYPGSDGTIRDLGKLREYFALGLARAPALKFELLEVLHGVGGLCIYYINARGGHSAEYVELDESDRAIRVIVCYS